MFQKSIITIMFACFVIHPSSGQRRTTRTTTTTTTTTTPTTTVTTPVVLNYSASVPVYVKTGVILTVGTTTAYDYNVLGPALDAAYAKAIADYNVMFQVQNFLYEVADTGSSSPDPALGKTQGCWMWNASGAAADAVNSSMQVVIGPACTDDMRIANELLTFFKIPCITGAGNFLDSTEKYSFLTRTGFNTFDLWRFVLMVFKKYQWSDIVIIYDKDNLQITVEANSLIASLKRELMNPYDILINGTEFDEFDNISLYLDEASQHGRVIVFLLNGTLTRYFLVEATRAGMADGSYVFVAADLFLDDLLGQAGHWKQRDGYDRDALQAYSHLFILTLKDVHATAAYKLLEGQMRNQSTSTSIPGSVGRRRRRVTMNYYSGAFYDAVLMLARSIREAVDNMQMDPHTIDPPSIIQGLVNRTFAGASGAVYINQKGDRSDDLSLYYMTDTRKGDFGVVAEYNGLKGTYELVNEIIWRNADNSSPPNTPLCGYQNDKCVDTTTIASVAGVLGALLVIGGGGAALFFILKARKERMRLNSDWIAEWEELAMDNSVAGGSRMSMRSIGSSTASSTSKPSITSEEGSQGSHPRKGKPPPSLGHLMFGSWHGRVVMIIKCESRPLLLSKELMAEVKIVRGIVHENLLKFLGGVIGTENVAVIGDYCSKGTLQDLLADETAKLDWIFRYSLINDVVKGVAFIQAGPLGCHGRLNSGCCYVDGKFVLKVGDYGLPSFYKKPIPLELDNVYYASLYWTAPELLDYPNGPGTPEGDSYAYAIILQEVILREEPYSMYNYEPQDIIDRVRSTEVFFRPNVVSPDCPLGLLALMDQCWQHDPLERPRFPQIKTSLRQVTRGAIEKHNIVDLLISRMEQYTADLEKMVEEKTEQFQEEKKKADALLNQILPASIAEKLKRGEVIPPESFDSATIFFSDCPGFAALSMESTAIQIVDFLNDLYSLFDGVIPKFDVYKVETIHDSYMVASGLPVRNGLNHAKEQAMLSLTLMKLIANFKIRHRPLEKVKLRIGLNSGPVVTSVIGLAVPRYCLFGDTVNTASRMESTGEGLRIQISPTTKYILDGFGMFETADRGEIEVKGKGKIHTYWLVGERKSLSEMQAEAEQATVTEPGA